MKFLDEKLGFLFFSFILISCGDSNLSKECQYYEHIKEKKEQAFTGEDTESIVKFNQAIGQCLIDGGGGLNFLQHSPAIIECKEKLLKKFGEEHNCMN